MEYRIYVINLKHTNGIVTCGSFQDAEREFEECNSIDGGTAHLQVFCPLLGWASIRSKAKGGYR